VTTTQVAAKSQIDVIDSEMIDYMTKSGKVKAKELAELVGIGVPSTRLRLFKLMSIGIVGQEKTRNHQVWYYAKREGSRTGIDVLRGE